MEATATTAESTSTGAETAAKKPYSRLRNNREAVPGYALLHAILDEQAKRGENSFAGIIDGLAITQTSWNAIANGSRDIRSIASNAGRRRWIANYLGIPPAAVRVMAGEMPIEDLKIDVSLDDRLRLTANELRDDPVWTLYAPEDMENEWDILPVKTRMLIKALYDSEKKRIYQWTLENTAREEPEPSREEPTEAPTEEPPPVVDDI